MERDAAAEQRFFAGHPAEQDIFEALVAAVGAIAPGSEARVAKTQVSLYDGRMFACASLPRFRVADKNTPCLLLSLGMGRPLESPRCHQAVKINGRRYTNHVPLFSAADVDDEVREWLTEAYAFACSR